MIFSFGIAAPTVTVLSAFNCVTFSITLGAPLNKEDKESKKDNDWFADGILRMRSPLKL